MTDFIPSLVHATAVAIDRRVVLLLGASGSGKSDLALRLIDRSASLVSDDYTELTATPLGLMAAPPARIAGRMEIRHVGIVAMHYQANLPVALAIRLDDSPERMPDRSHRTTLSGVDVPIIAIDPREASAPLKVEWALRTLAGL